ncbi:hypothetical protein HFD88_008341 [Aspergillus terreus]|nr:hypothetical protein HFD88_008341 [Aspergillus terreus]
MSAEERVNAMRGYKSTLSNPRTSNEAKKHAQEMLNELGGDQPREELHAHAEHGKDPTRVVSGLKAAMHNPNVTESGRQHAEERLSEMGERPEE